MTTPIRIQLSRRRGWRKPAGAVVVSRPGKWGNPFTIGGKHFDYTLNRVVTCRDAAHAVALFKQWLRLFPLLREQIKRELRGKDLACWCRVLECPGCHMNFTERRYKRCPLCGCAIVRVPCHADVLIEEANYR